MPTLAIPPNDIPIDDWLPQLRQTAHQNLPLARRAALLRLVWQESYLTRRGLIARVEDLLGRGCFGRSPRQTFYRDLAVVRQALAETGRRLVYCRQIGRTGYWIEGRPLLDERLQRLIAGAVAEVDPAQIAIYKNLNPARRIRQLGHLSDWLRQANERRLQRRRVA